MIRNVLRSLCALFLNSDQLALDDLKITIVTQGERGLKLDIQSHAIIQYYAEFMTIIPTILFSKQSY